MQKKCNYKTPHKSPKLLQERDATYSLHNLNYTSFCTRPLGVTGRLERAAEQIKVSGACRFLTLTRIERQASAEERDVPNNTVQSLECNDWSVKNTLIYKTGMPDWPITVIWLFLAFVFFFRIYGLVSFCSTVSVIVTFFFCFSVEFILFCISFVFGRLQRIYSFAVHFAPVVHRSFR